ncbi:MAG TPA: hypothetical protein VF230_17255 [Acidimicrobiales bacterium]
MARPDVAWSEVVAFVSLLAVAAYAFLGGTAFGFYRLLGVSFEEVGLDYATIMSRSLVLGVLLLVIIAGIAGLVPAIWATNKFVEGTERHAGTERALGWLIRAVLVSALVFGTIRTATTASMIAVAATIVAAGSAAIGYVLMRHRQRLWVAAYGATMLSGTVLGALLLGESWADRVLSSSSEAPTLASIGLVRWPTPVYVEGEVPDLLVQPPEGVCSALLIGSSDSYHVLLERTSERSAVFRVPVEQVSLRTVVRVKSSGAPAKVSNASTCARDLDTPATE